MAPGLSIENPCIPYAWSYVSPNVKRCCLCLWLASAAHAQTPSVTFPDFSSTKSLNLLADARRSGNALRLTPAKNDRHGAAWLATRQPVAGGFETEFQFQLTNQGGLGKGADGLAFVLQNSGPDAIAGIGSSGGFAIGNGTGDLNSSGIARSIAVFFDTYRNEEEHDPSNNYVAICTHGKVGEMQWPPARLAIIPKLKANLKDKRVHLARITFEPPVMRVFLDDLRSPVLTSTVDLSTVVDAAGTTFLGFTASTGGGYENHDLLRWSFNGLKPDITSAMVTSDISFLAAACLPDRNLCTPDRPIVDEKAPGQFHIVLPANLEWSASIPNRGQSVEIRDAHGIV